MKSCLVDNPIPSWLAAPSGLSSRPSAFCNNEYENSAPGRLYPQQWRYPGVHDDENDSDNNNNNDDDDDDDEDGKEEESTVCLASVTRDGCAERAMNSVGNPKNATGAAFADCVMAAVDSWL